MEFKPLPVGKVRTTWSDAAEKVLRKEQHPLHYKVLTQKILGQKLVQTKSKAPHIAFYASLAVDNSSRREKGVPPRFSIEKGEVSLTEWEAHKAKVAIFRHAQTERARVKDQLLRKLRQLSGGKFESYMEALLIKMGYENVELRGGPTDEGIDLFCEMSQGINQVKTAVQTKCKQKQNKVGPKDVRLLRDVLPKFKCSQGVLVTTSTFTPQAQAAATEEGRLPIILIDSNKLAELAIEHEAGIRGAEIKIYSVDDNFDLFKGTSSHASS